MSSFPIGEPDGAPTLDHLKTYARRLGVEVRTRGPVFRRLADRTVVAVDVEIRQAGADDSAWRRLAPSVHALEGQDGDGFLSRMARLLAWLRFVDLVALPRLPGHDGWSDVSVKAVTDHVCLMLGLPQPDVNVLDRCLATWRESGVEGLTPRRARTSAAKRPRSKARKTVGAEAIVAPGEGFTDARMTEAA
jgi:hypothetical protein